MNTKTAPETKESGPVFQGIAAAPGIAIGKAYVLDKRYFCALRQPIDPEEVESEIQRFHDAVDASLNEMSGIRDGAMAELGGNVPLLLLEAHAQILKDPTLLTEVEENIRSQLHNAEWALESLLEDYQARFSKIKSNYFRERLNDIKAAIERLQGSLVHGESWSSSLTEPVILVAHDLSPADTLQLDASKILAIATDAGGKTSHAGILAASMDIPAVVGLKNMSMNLTSGDTIIVDGSSGNVILSPDKSQFLDYNSKRQKYLYVDNELHTLKDKEARTKDGVLIKMLANIESTSGLPHIEEHGAEGVGLFRTEYLYLRKSAQPDEEEQYLEYRRLAESMGQREAIIRTFDLGGDKLGIFTEMADEPNPALGLRAIRFSLAYKQMFKTQLRAILRASVYGDVRVMYPLITSLEELLEANKVLEETKDELRNEGAPFNEEIKTGIMIETPSSVMIAPELASHCDFFSIGTNDLIQYTMAIDRVNEWVAYLYQPLSPAILRMIQAVIKAADEKGVEVSVCGKMAGDPVYALLLIGFGGVRELSMDPHSIPRMKKAIRSVRIEDCQSLAKQVVTLGSVKEVRDHVMETMASLFGKDVFSSLLGDDI